MQDRATPIPGALPAARTLHNLTRARGDVEIGFIGVDQPDAVKRPVGVELLMNHPLVVVPRPVNSIHGRAAEPLGGDPGILHRNVLNGFASVRRYDCLSRLTCDNVDRAPGNGYKAHAGGVCDSRHGGLRRHRNSVEIDNFTVRRPLCRRQARKSNKMQYDAADKPCRDEEAQNDPGPAMKPRQTSIQHVRNTGGSES